MKNMRAQFDDDYGIEKIENTMYYYGILYQADAIVLLDEIRRETDRMINLFAILTEEDVASTETKVDFYERELITL